jgi:hypothetical protein
MRSRKKQFATAVGLQQTQFKRVQAKGGGEQSAVTEEASAR